MSKLFTRIRLQVKRIRLQIFRGTLMFMRVQRQRKTEAYIRFPLPGLPDGAIIDSATIQAYNYLSKTGPTAIDVYRITNWWGASTTNWNNKPLRSTTPEVSGNVSAAGWQSFAITSLAKDGYTGHTANNGVAFLANPDTAEGVGFTSSNHTDSGYRPKMVITYRFDPEGFNHFWTYTADGVMPFVGNLFLSTTDLGTPGRGIDAVVTRSYNSRQSTKEGVFGPGWLSNRDMRVWNLSGSVVFLDAAGSRHLFDRLPNGTILRRLGSRFP